MKIIFSQHCSSLPCFFFEDPKPPCFLNGSRRIDWKIISQHDKILIITEQIIDKSLNVSLLNFFCFPFWTVIKCYVCRHCQNYYPTLHYHWCSTSCKHFSRVLFIFKNTDQNQSETVTIINIVFPIFISSDL